MDVINWKDEYSVGVKEMDDQHKKLIGMVNKLISEQKSLTDPRTIADLLTEMTEYAQVHFRAEEYLMAEYGYDQKDLQETQHQAFIDETIAFYSATDIGPNILSTALLDYLATWLIEHILKEDMKYKEFFISKGLS
ncbi:MAG: hemerythrin family protein [Desulfobulbaceae bacterium]|nr:hemerythrin family protein [Desulfobulbaceae bacterium]